MAPDVQRLGKPVMIAGTDPQLTHMGNPWLFRFRPNERLTPDRCATDREIWAGRQCSAS
jgi:hypothetical protein